MDDFGLNPNEMTMNEWVDIMNPDDSNPNEMAMNDIQPGLPLDIDLSEADIINFVNSLYP